MFDVVLGQIMFLIIIKGRLFEVSAALNKQLLFR